MTPVLPELDAPYPPIQPSEVQIPEIQPVEPDEQTMAFEPAMEEPLEEIPPQEEMIQSDQHILEEQPLLPEEESIQRDQTIQEEDLLHL
jgi:hypothetical protein